MRVPRPAWPVVGLALAGAAAGGAAVVAGDPLVRGCWVVAALTLAILAAVADRRAAARRAGYAAAARALDHRLKAIESVVAGKFGAGFEEVLKLVLDAAVDVARAHSGSIDFVEERSDELALSQKASTPLRGLNRSGGFPVQTVPLRYGGNELGGLVLAPRPDGMDELGLAAIRSAASRIALILSSARSIAEQRDSTAYLEAANLVKSRFLTTISHELRTPLTSIIGYSKTMDNHWSRLGDDQKREFVREIEKQSNRLYRLVERILEAARVELQGVVIKPVEHDVRHTIQKTLAPFMATEAHRLQVALPDRPIEAELDPFVIEQVVSNVVDNSLRYTKGAVRVSLDAYRSSVTIAVTDEGPGIDAGRLNLVLEPLYRIDENVQSGTGLGLHIVRTLVEAHGGRGEIRSGETGTAIAIKLPRTAASRISTSVAGPPSRTYSPR